ncbi:MAG: 3-hydroxyacyl-CoA dehydrogenase [Proteobacteria bacterium]|nr:3-hydroxyacyl-CoA dehydrogenase [Pseudomonadota bacterium]MBU1582980.1 3-hydroxyacyl-CoA dehydrogenase [Pseudomonadota bacterium]MBU2631773.1 3-hydroxyacyl-CoA dehydrogenase [Pseudomonadota bacterium]
MNIEDIKNISVIGAGNMGHQICLQSALKGFNTVCTDVSKKLLKKADDFVDSYLAGRVEHYVKGEYGQKTKKGWYDYTKQ